VNAQRNWASLTRAAGLLLAALLLSGQLAGAFHSHSSLESERDCSVCALAHSPADATQPPDAPIAQVIIARRVVVAGVSAPACAPRRPASSRAPPLV
jgi:hypothetical protein